MLDLKPLWNFDDPAASRARFEGLYSELLEAEARAVVLTQIARTHGLEGQFEVGHELLDSIEPLDDGLNAWVEIERGRLLRSAGDSPAARGHFEAGARAAENSGQIGLQFDALHMMALTLPAAEQVSFTQQVIAAARASQSVDAQNWVASLLNNLGMAQSELGDWAAARASFEEALAERVRLGDASRIYPARYMVGWTMRNQGERQAALAWMTDLQRDLLAAGRSDEFVAAELALLSTGLDK